MSDSRSGSPIPAYQPHAVEQMPTDRPARRPISAAITASASGWPERRLERPVEPQPVERGLLAAQAQFVGQQRGQGARGGAGVALGGDGEQRARDSSSRKLVRALSTLRNSAAMASSASAGGGQQAESTRRSNAPGFVALNASQDRGSVNSDPKVPDS